MIGLVYCSSDYFFFFFFSSRRRHTRWPRDWSSEVCSSDLAAGPLSDGRPAAAQPPGGAAGAGRQLAARPAPAALGYGEGRRHRPPAQPAAAALPPLPPLVQIGRAPCRERAQVCVGGGSLSS